MEDSIELPKNTPGDIAYTVTKAIFSGIPGLGGPISELLSLIVQPPLLQRKHEWEISIGKAIEELQARNQINIKDLSENEAFVDVVIQSTMIAMRTSQKDKINALKNALLNSSHPGSPLEESQRHMFLNYIDIFTEWHLKILDLFNEPNVWFHRNSLELPKYYGTGLSTILEFAFEELKGRQDFYDQIWKDLFDRGLVSTSGLHATMTGNGLMVSRTTEIGKMFITFISDSH